MGKTFWHSVLCVLGLEKALSQTTQREREALCRHAVGRRRAVEIGVYEGVTTAVLAAAIRSGGGVLYAVDPFLPGRAGICWGEWVARTQVRRSGAAEVVKFVKMLSRDASRSIEGEFDLVFVDGDHSLDGIAGDWKDWSGRIVKGGVIGLHDTRVPEYNPRVRDLGSYQYFESTIRKDPRFELLEQVDSLSVLRRI